MKQHAGFNLSDACFPTSARVRLKEGFMLRRPQLAGKIIPSMVICSSSEKNFELFMEFAALFRKNIDVILEDSYDDVRVGKHRHSYAECTDSIVLRSYLFDFEDLFKDDGFVGIVLLDKRLGFEVAFNEHKYFVIYNWAIFRNKIHAILEKFGIQRNKKLRLVSRCPHTHEYTTDSMARFEEFKKLLGATY